ncbi:MAG: LysR family transcriptional regulator [Rhodospirillales bacterium]|nr:LysR family transcriptional regulator [Rhodospirillales bacterium]MBO6787322.1 LysR family transcriptional regulator [Rhodospirillales bacterium]
MKYIQLRAFHTVAREQSVSRAADALNVTQPAVTLHLQALEDTYGVTLFNRTKNGVILTRDGRDLYALTGRMFAEEADIQAFLQGTVALERGHLSISADGPHVALDLVSEYRTRHPGIEVSMTLGNADETLDDVMTGRVDAALLANPPKSDRLARVPVLRQSMVAVVARDHPWAAKKDIELADLTGEPVILRESGSMTRRTLERALEKKKIRTSPVMELGSREAVKEAAAHGMGIGFMQERETVGDTRVVGLGIRDLRETNLDTLVCLKRNAGRRTIKALLEVARDLAAVR